jgi:uncharacterized membrane protein
MFLGGWLSFTGELGKGGWGRSKLADILPVKCLEYEDLNENTEGFHPKIDPFWKSSFPGIDFKSAPPFLGYNRTVAKRSSDILMTVKETEDPLLALGKYGKGKVLAYMSDPAPHWGCNFVYWKQYNEFWLDCVNLLFS